MNSVISVMAGSGAALGSQTKERGRLTRFGEPPGEESAIKHAIFRNIMGLLIMWSRSLLNTT